MKRAILIFSLITVAFQTTAICKVSYEADLSGQIVEKLVNIYQSKNYATKRGFIVEEIQDRKSFLSSEKSEQGIPHIATLNFNDLKVDYKHSITLRDFGLYKLTHKSPHAYTINLHNVKTYTLTFLQELIKKNRNSGPFLDLEDNDFLRSAFTCSGPYKIKTEFRFKKRDANYISKFSWGYNEGQARQVAVKLTKASGECKLRFKKSTGSEVYGLNIIPETKTMTDFLSKTVNQFEYCELPQYQGDSGLDNFFMNSQFNSMTCPREVDEIKMLDNGIDGMNAKVKALLGNTVPQEMLETKNPYLDLDFSKAPKLDAIYLSYLVFRRDFYGTVMERLLRYHAKKGTKIKILVSEVISLDKDIIMLDRLDKEFSNVMVRFYKFNTYKMFNSWGEMFSQLHRTMHVKMFLTYSSKEDAGPNVAIIGGKNIHDGFVFKTKVDLSKYPHLVQYGIDEDVAIWNDFEVELNGRDIVRSFIGHYNSLFEYDRKNYFFRNYTFNRTIDAKLDHNYLNDNKILFRHFMSFPYKDNLELEKFIVRYIDSSKKEIKLVTPYLNLTKNIAKALGRAVDRGVEIEILTRLDLEGDIADVILSDVNKSAVNKFLKKVTMYEYVGLSTILHSKLILVDGLYTTVGSINLNQRSFYHDLENTLLIRSPRFNNQIAQLIERYKRDSVLISQKQKIKFWKRIVIGIFKKAL